MADRPAGSVWQERAPEIDRMIREGWTNAQMAVHYDVSVKTFRNQVGRLRAEGLVTAKRGEGGIKVVVDTSLREKAQAEMDRYGTTVDVDWKTGAHKSNRLVLLAEEPDKDEEALLRAHGYDPSKWKLTSSTSKRWHGYSKVDGIFTLFASTIRVEPQQQGKTDEEWMEFFIKLSRDYQSPVHAPTNYSTDGKMLEIDVADLHLAKLSWDGDSGDTYNHEVARERFFYILNDVITKTQNFTFERVLFIWSNDFFHVDGPGKTTTKGTPQDASMQFEHMFEYGSEMLVQGMDLVSEIAPTTTLYVASNHDRLTSFFATKYLQAWYRNNKHVEVDSRPLSRKAVKYGLNLTGFTHGHLEQKRMGTWMSVDYAKDWGETIFHEVHAHHIHSQKAIIEENGQTTRFMSSPTGTDRWHHDSAWTGAIERAQSFIYDREMGIENVINSTIPLNRRKKQALIIGD